MKPFPFVVIALSLLISGTARGPQAAVGEPIEIISATVDRYLLFPKVLSADWFFMEQPQVGKAYVRVTGRTDINEWLDAYKGKAMTLLVSEGRDYEFRENERGTRGIVGYSHDVQDQADDFFVANVGLVVKAEKKANDRFVEQRELSKKLKSFVDREIVLIFRPG